jgi:oligopeptide transport system substrate-binding protein
MVRAMKNVFRLSFQKDPLTLDPQKSGDRFSSAIIFLLFRGLTRLEADHKVNCDLASSIQILDNYKKYIFHLGEHTWSDGTPITAHDFVHSWRRALNPAFPTRAINLFYYIKNAQKAKKGQVSPSKVGVYAKDDVTLVVDLEYPCPYFLEITSFCPLFPVPNAAEEHEVPKICSGSFQLEYWNRGEEIFLKRNHFSRCVGAGNIDTIHIKMISDAKEAFALFESDELDWLGDPISPLPVNHLPTLLWAKKIKPVSGVTSCWFNTLKSPFSNVNLRKALGYAIPREKLLEKLVLPNTVLAKSFCTSLLQGDEAPTLVKECPTIARALFEAAAKELKFKKLKMTLSYEETEEFSRLAFLLKSHWEEMFEISLQLEPLSFKEFWQRLPMNQFEMSLVCSASQYTDTINFLERLEFKDAPRNFSGWENAQYQAFLKQYRETFDDKTRQELAVRAESLLLEEMPISPIYYYHFAYLQKAHVKNLVLSPVGVVQLDRVVIEKKQLAPSRSLIATKSHLTPNCDLFAATHFFNKQLQVE